MKTCARRRGAIRFLSVLVVLSMLLGHLPVTVLASGEWDGSWTPNNSWNAIELKGNYRITDYDYSVDVRCKEGTRDTFYGFDTEPDQIRIVGKNITNINDGTGVGFKEEGQTYEVRLRARPRITQSSSQWANVPESCDLEISNARNFILKVILYDFGVPDTGSDQSYKKINNIEIHGNVQVELRNSSVDGTLLIENTNGSSNYVCPASAAVFSGIMGSGYAMAANTKMLDDCDVTVGRCGELTLDNSAGLTLDGRVAKSITVSHTDTEQSGVIFRNITIPDDCALSLQAPARVSLIGATTMGQLIFDGNGQNKSFPFTLALNGALMRESVTVRNYGTLTISLAGENALNTYSEIYNPNRGNRPDIMVANDSSLIIQDDPAQADVGSLAIGAPAVDPYSNEVLYYADAGHYYCAAIGGTPSFDPLPHGTVTVKSGVLTAQAQYGGAAIGGSTEKPYVYYDGEGHIDLENSMPGFTPDGGTVNITGGIVNVTATGGGAAIGGARGGDGGIFTIKGGTVNAVASMGAAAIGGGAWQFKQNASYEFVMENNLPVLSGGAGGTISIEGGCVVNCKTENNYYTLNGLPKTSYSASRDDLYALQGGYADYGYTETRGYVIGASAIGRMRSSDKITITAKNGVSPLVMLQQNVSNTYMGSMGGTVGENDAEWDYFLYPNNVRILDTDSGESYEPTYIYNAVILLIGREFIRDVNGDVVENPDEMGKYVINTHAISGWRSNRTVQPLVRNNYKVRGVIPLPAWPDPWYSDERFTEFTLPEGSTITLLSGAVMNVASGFFVHGEEEQLVVEDGAVIQGRGIWPGKPAIDPNDTPNESEVKDLLEYLKSLEDQSSEVGTDNAGADSASRTIVTHLGIARADNGDRYIIPGDSVDEIKNAAAVDGAEVITVINAGYCGFRKDTSAANETWNLLISNLSTVVSLVENSALSLSQRQNSALGVSVAEDNGAVTITGTNAKLVSPDYAVYESKANNPIVLTFSPEDDEEENSHNDALAFVMQLDASDNDAVFSVPNFLGSSFVLESVAPLKDKCALRYGGTLSFHTPVANFADVEINQLQINYGGGIALGGIEGGGEVHIPEFGGFPVSGGAELHINTFGGEQEYSLSLELETPIFEGAFEASFKEARGVVLPDTLYAELAVGEGGIPLVPPTIIGYIQGGGLGFSGLADTVAMNSFGAPPIRLKMAARGSLFDVMNGWVDLSVGPSGFDLGMRDIEIKGVDLIKYYGISASWNAGTREIHNLNYWGVNANLEQKLKIALGYNGKDFLTAEGAMGFGGFTGYAIDGNIARVVIQFEGYGSLKGALQIPAGLIGPVPFDDFEVANAEIGIYTAVGATNTINKNNIQGASPMRILRELVTNTKPYFDVAVGAKAVINGGTFVPTCHVKITYVFGDTKPGISGGTGTGDDLNLSSLAKSSPQTRSAKVAAVHDDETDTDIPAIYEVGAVVEASARMADVVDSTASGIKAAGRKASGDNALGDRAAGSKGGATVLSANSSNSFTATVPNGAVGNILIAVNAADGNEEMDASTLTVTRDGESVELIQAVYSNNELVNGDTANFFAGTGVAYFAPTAAGTYDVISTVELESADAIRMVPFAMLGTGTDADEATASYSVESANAEHRYKVQLFLDETQGEPDYLLAEKELYGDTSFAGVFEDYILTGGAVPTGDYYPTFILLEYVEAVDENGTIIETWSPLDRKDLTTTVAYTNNVMPEAPANVTLAYSGNETMTASWSAVANAESYQISVYDEDGKDTGLLFQVNKGENNAAPGTSIVMDLSSLESGKTYRAGVKAKVLVDGNSVASCEGRSAQVLLNAAEIPQIELAGNITVGEGGLNAFSVGAAGGSFTVSSTQMLDYYVADKATGAVLQSAENTDSITFEILAGDASLDGATLQVVATDPATGDYAVQYFSVNLDITAPALVLDHLGVFPLTQVEAGYITCITGNSEPGAMVLVWEEGSQSILTAKRVDENGSFSISLNFKDKPANEIFLRAKDAAGNLSEAMKVNFPDDNAILVTISYDPNSEDAFSATAGVEIKANTPIGALPAAYWTDDVKLFDGWYDAAEGGNEVTAVSTFACDTTLYAHWADAVKLGFDPGDGSCDTAGMAVKAGSSVGELPVPVYAGKMFTGWYTAASGGERVTETSVFDLDMTLYAHWSDYVTVTFDAGLGSCAVETMQVPLNGTIEEYPVPTARGYDFNGWYNGETVATLETMYFEDQTLTAQWTRRTDSLAVTQADGIVGETLPDPVFDRPADIVGEPTVSYKGYKGGAVVYQSAAKPTAPGTYTVTVQCDTFGKAYVGTAEFVIIENAAFAPVFRTQSLLLSGQIGVNFFMDLSCLSDAEKEASYMTFSIPHGPITERAAFNPDFKNASDEFFGFTCYVNSVQMAESITVTFHYTQDGTEKTVERTYSVSEYFYTFDRYIDSLNDSDPTMVNLVKAVADYGHYIQPFLAWANDWVVGTNYAEAEKHYAEAFDLDSVAAAVSDKGFAKTTNADVTAITFSLLLSSETSIYVYFAPASGYEGSFTVTVDDNAVTPLTENGRYVVRIPNVAAHLLSTTHEIVVTTDSGTATVSVSALSYVKAMLDNYTGEDDGFKLAAAAAIYQYSKAADDYKLAHQS